MLVVVKTAITQLNLSKSAFIPLPHHHIKACEMQKKSVSIIICGYNYVSRYDSMAMLWCNSNFTDVVVQTYSVLDLPLIDSFSL